MRAVRRDKIQIYADILRAVEDEFLRHREAKVTRVQYRAGVPFDRFKGYLKQLNHLGLVEVAGTLRLTGKGREFLDGCERIRSFLN